MEIKQSNYPLNYESKHFLQTMFVSSRGKWQPAFLFPFKLLSNLEKMSTVGLKGKNQSKSPCMDLYLTSSLFIEKDI
jgi:hypothetical protein